MKNKRALIFGANGQDGFYLAELLQQHNIETIKISRTGTFVTGDVGDLNFVQAIIKQHQPQYIFHLAANSTTRHNVLFENHESISTGTINILESARLYCPDASIFISGTALQFKNEGDPINEQTAFDASSAYSVARIQSVYAARYFREAFSLKVYVGYFFNHDSPLRTEQHVNQKIVKTINRIAGGSNERLLIGNMDVQKEFNYAGDIVAAVWKLVNQQNVFEAVLGCGKAYSIRDWIVYCFEKRNMNWADYTDTDQGFISGYEKLVSDPRLIMNMGWAPQVNFYQLADLMLNS